VSPGLRTDPVLLEILRNRFKAVAEEMAATTLRTAYTVFVKETHDFDACLVSPWGEVFAAPTDTAVSIMAGLPAWEAVDAFDDYEEGDVGIANDPDSTHGLSTHLPDIWLWKPIFAEGRIIAFALSFIHSSDVGGKVAGSISPTSDEIFQEGLRIPPMKLYRAGVANQELLDLILLNSRIPEQNRGDIRSQLASLNIAERGMRELVARYGAATVEAGIEDVMDQAEHRARALIEEIPDGDYEFVDYLEGDDVGVGLIRIKLTLRVRGSNVVMDFAGTDYQVRAALNLPSWNQRGHRQLCFAFLNYFRSLAPDVPYNSGLVRPIELRIPKGTLLNPEPGAAYGVRAATMFRILDNVSGCLSQAIPGVMPAASSGAVAIVLLSVHDLATGAWKVEVAQPLSGGSGGRPRQDGIDGASFTGGWLRNIPNEVLEADMPIVVEEYGYRPGAAGAGEHRGGAGIRFRFRSLAPEMLMTARGLERFTFRPWGLAGGMPGQLGKVLLNPGTPKERSLGKLDVLNLEAGDVVQFETASGGGFGDPWRRPPERVLADVEAGFLSPAEAEHLYAVAIRDGAVNAEATEGLRRRPREPRPWLNVGPERLAHEVVYSDEVASEIIRILEPFPTRLRSVLQSRLGRALAGRSSAPTHAELADLLETVCRQVGILMPRATVGAGK
jgi:N-methylhydantoinase B